MVLILKPQQILGCPIQAVRWLEWVTAAVHGDVFLDLVEPTNLNQVRAPIRPTLLSQIDDRGAGPAFAGAGLGDQSHVRMPLQHRPQCFA